MNSFDILIESSLSNDFLSTGLKMVSSENITGFFRIRKEIPIFGKLPILLDLTFESNKTSLNLNA